MPEGPEVRTVARTLQSSLVGQSLGTMWHSGARLRKEIDGTALANLENAVIDNVCAYGKVLFIESLGKPIIVAQLGMTGQLVVTKQSATLAPHTHVRWPLNNSPLELRYVDPRRFGWFGTCDQPARTSILKKLGPDPFGLTKADYPHLIDRLRASTREIKAVLLDQSVLVGVGNIYASEALFHSRINPLTRASNLTHAQCSNLIDAVVSVLHQAYQNSGTTFSNYVDGAGNKGKNAAFLQVFQRTGQPCTACSESIKSIKQGGRTTFYCPQCQGS